MANEKKLLQTRWNPTKQCWMVHKSMLHRDLNDPKTLIEYESAENLK